MKVYTSLGHMGLKLAKWLEELKNIPPVNFLEINSEILIDTKQLEKSHLSKSNHIFYWFTLSTQSS